MPHIIRTVYLTIHQWNHLRRGGGLDLSFRLWSKAPDLTPHLLHWTNEGWEEWIVLTDEEE